MPRSACGMSVKLCPSPDNNHFPSTLFPAVRTVEFKPGRDLHHDPRARKVAAAVARVPGVERVLLFGSRARGDHREDSDINLLVMGPRDAQFDNACRTAANIAMQSAYDRHVGIDVVPLEPAHFDFMQHGINHIAAKAARDGITTMGHRYKPPTDPVGSGRPEHRRREARERAWATRSCLNNLEWTYRMDPESCPDPMEWDMQVGARAQETLDHALTALSAAHGHSYARTHNLPDLLQGARPCIPDLVLHSDLAKLSRFADGDAYGNPDLDIDPEQMLINVRSDVARLFDICACEASFAPWTFRKTDFQRGA